MMMTFQEFYEAHKYKIGDIVRVELLDPNHLADEIVMFSGDVKIVKETGFGEFEGKIINIAYNHNNDMKFGQTIAFSWKQISHRMRDKEKSSYRYQSKII